jgi:hypothetical protein
VSTLLVGGGPAASGLLAAADRTGILDALLGDGLTVVDSGPAARFGAGRLGGYLVRSDTRARVFAECARPVLGQAGTTGGLLACCDSDEPVPLRMAAELLAAVGGHLLERIRGHHAATVLSETEVTGVLAGADGVTVQLTGRPPLRADRVVLTVGGRPWTPPGLPRDGRMVLHSDQVLQEDGYQAVLSRLSRGPARVTVIGGAHSAFAVAGLLLRAPLPWRPGAITIAHRSPVLVTYPDAAAAHADGVPAGPEEICPATGLVHRFGGLRADAAALYQRIRRGREPRVRLVPVSPGWDWFADVAGTDPVMVAATGYGSAAAPLAPAGSWWDSDGRLRTAADEVVPRVFGLGLGTRRPRGPRTGGESAFSGAIDGVWFYQQIVAPELLAVILEDAPLR